MRFLYIFGLMFISIFGLVMLVKVLADALKSGSTRKFDIYVRADEHIGEFLEGIRNNPLIGTVNILAEKDSEEFSRLEMLPEKYNGVRIVKEDGETGDRY